MRIITSIYVYNSHLIISYLKEGIKIIPFSDNRKGSSFYKSKTKYVSEIIEANSLIELQGNKHILFGTQNCTLTSYDLINGEAKSVYRDDLEFYSEDISQLAVNYRSQKHNLFTFSEQEGFSEIDISSRAHLKFTKKYTPKFLEQISYPVISNMVPYSDYLLISVRNFGIAPVSLFTNDNEVTDYYLKEAVETEDAQDAKKMPRSYIIAIADSEAGLILYDFKNNEVFRTVKLPNHDFPQQIEIIYSDIIIKGSQGIYSYSLKSNKLSVLREGKIGALTTYYDYIFFSNKGKVFLITPDNVSKQRDFNLETEGIDLEFKTIQRKQTN